MRFISFFFFTKKKPEIIVDLEHDLAINRERKGHNQLIDSKIYLKFGFMLNGYDC